MTSEIRTRIKISALERAALDKICMDSTLVKLLENTLSLEGKKYVISTLWVKARPQRSQHIFKSIYIMQHKFKFSGRFCPWNIVSIILREPETVFSKIPREVMPRSSQIRLKESVHHRKTCIFQFCFQWDFDLNWSECKINPRPCAAFYSI